MFHWGERSRQRKRERGRERRQGSRNMCKCAASLRSTALVGARGRQGWKCTFPARQAPECPQPPIFTVGRPVRS